MEEEIRTDDFKTTELLSTVRTMLDAYEHTATWASPSAASR